MKVSTSFSSCHPCTSLDLGGVLVECEVFNSDADSTSGGDEVRAESHNSHLLRVSIT